MRINVRSDVIENATRYNIRRYSDGRIDKIDAFKGKQLIHTTQAIYSTFNNLTRLTDVQGYLFDEVWNSAETPELSWYDRNPKNVFPSYSALVTSPVGIYTAWSYTVPKNRKAFLEIARVSLLQQTASTGAAGGNASVFMIIYPNNPPPTFTESILEVTFEEPTLMGSTDVESAGQTVTLMAGDILVAEVISTCVNGTFYAKAQAKLTEFDA